MSEDLSSSGLTMRRLPDIFRRRKIYMARKRRIANVSENIQVGDLIHYCPVDMESRYHEYGLILDISETNTYSLQRDFTVLWQKSNQIQVHSSSYMNHSLMNKKITLYKP